MKKKNKCKNYPRQCKSWGQINADGLCPACARRQAASVLLEAIKTDVQKMHSNSGILGHLDVWRAQGASYALIASALPKGITSQDIRRLHLGEEPKSNRKRALLGLQKFIRVEACAVPNCQEGVHLHQHGQQVYNPTTETKRRRARRWRQPREYKDLFDMPPALLRLVLERRELL